MTYNELFTAVKNYLQNDFPTNTWTNVAGTGTATSNGTSQINFFIQQAEERVYNSVQIPALRKSVIGTVEPGNKYLSCPSDFLSVFSIAVYTPPGGAYEYLLNKDVNFIRAAYPFASDMGTPKYYALFGPTVAAGVVSDELSFILGPAPDGDYNVELHYYYYPESIIQSPITSLGALAGGSGYANGTYYNTPLTGGVGSGAIADIVVSGGTVTSVSLINGGANYVVGNSLSATINGGTGFSIPVAAVGNTNGRTWLADNYSPVLLYGTLVEAYTFLKGEQDLIALYEKKYQDALMQLNRLGTGLERGDAYRDGQAKIKVMP